MSERFEIDIPGRKPDEPAATDKQIAFIEDLKRSIGAESLDLDPSTLGKWQASAWIDSLIALRDKEVKVKNHEVLDERATNGPPRKVSLLLGAGIFFFPIIFSWFTLQPGYSITARLISFLWLGWSIYAIAASGS